MLKTNMTVSPMQKSSSGPRGWRMLREYAAKANRRTIGWVLDSCFGTGKRPRRHKLKAGVVA